jgi:hypothetical protein
MINYICIDKVASDMVKMSAHLVVEGISPIGNTHIQAHGEVWVVIGMSGNVSTLKNIPGLLIQSAKTRFVKWMGRDTDEDFKIISTDCS